MIIEKAIIVPKLKHLLKYFNENKNDQKKIKKKSVSKYNKKRIKRLK